MLPWFLCPTSGTPAQRNRVLALLAKFKELAALNRDEKYADASVSEQLGYRILKPEFATASSTLEAEINKTLAKYPLRHVVCGPTSQASVLKIFPKVIKNSSNSLEMTESNAIGMIVDLANLGMLDLLKRCQECQRWFIASRKDRQFCTEPCKRRYQQSSPEFKRQRNEKARSDYAQRKTDGENSIRADGREPQSVRDLRKTSKQPKRMDQTSRKGTTLRP